MACGKNVIICESRVPFVRGGAELHVEGLKEAVEVAGYRVDVVSLPYEWDPPYKIVKSCLLWRMIELERTPAYQTDLLIATKFPTYAAEHPNKVAWVFHQHRSAYDLEGTIYDDLSRHSNGESYRELIKELDLRFLRECRDVFSTSRNVSGRLREYCGLESEVIYHPPPYDGMYYSGEYGNDVLLVGRLEPLKRVDLAITAMKAVTDPGAVLRVVGTGFLEEPLRELAVKEGVADRVSFEGFVSVERLLELYAGAGCVVYVPYDEDYGYATLEAFRSRRPVVVASDSGGAMEFVKEGENGLVVRPRPAELAGAIDELLSNREKARRFGSAGFESVEGVSWDGVIEKLVEPYLP